MGGLPDIAGLIHSLRGHRVMLSGDLARLYGVLPKALVQSVKRNRRRFPPDFSRHDTEIGSLIDAIRGSLTEEKPQRRIGFSSSE